MLFIPTLYFLTTVLNTACRGFNLEPRHSEIIADPAGDFNSYFGFALGFWRHTAGDGLNTWLVVGAPRGEVKELKGLRVRRPGVVYKCPVGQTNASCVMVPVLAKGENLEQDLVWRRKIKNIPARAWIGGTIAVEDKPNGAVLVCGPRMKRWMNVHLRYIPGTCYYWQNDTQVTTLPLIESVYPNKESGFETGFAQIGLSANFIQNVTEPQLVLGAPGLDYFRGGMAVFDNTANNKPLSSLHKPNAFHVGYDSYMGYCVVSARLHKDGSVSYIASAPRAHGSEFYTGVVYVVQKPHAAKWQDVMTLKGHQMGEYFGASLAVIDLDLDGHDDLLVVGAPQYSPPSTSEGASTNDVGLVYIYLNKGEAQLEQLEVQLTGSSVSGARFGTSLSVVGDINKDGYTDLAVGAPYEDDGAVYIYHGQDRGVRRRYSQRIAASDTGKGLRGFGISISSGMDIDGNSFNDIAVGSHESSKVIIIKSYPVIDFDVHLKPSVKRLDVNDDMFSIETCLKYSTKADSHLISGLDTELTLKVDTTLKRAEFQENGSETSTLTRHVRLWRDTVFCWSLNITLKGNLYQVTKPIELSLDYKVLNDPSINKDKEFCKLCPVTDPLKPSLVHIQVPFAHGCKNKKCQADLKVVVESSNKGRQVILGQDTRLTLLVTVSNSAEPAYLSKLSVTIPSRKMLLKVPTICYQDDTASVDLNPTQERLVCNLGNPLGNQIEKVSISFEFDLSWIDLHTCHLDFNFTAWSASDELTPKDNNYVLTIPISLVSRVVIYGKSTSTHVMFSSKDSEAPNIIPISHKYEVINYGPSPVGGVIAEFHVPVAFVQGVDEKANIFLSFPDPQLTLEGHIFRCDVDYNALNDSRINFQSPGWDLENSLQPETVPRPQTEAENDQQRRRRRRSVDNWTTNTTDLEKVYVKHALYLNCTSPNVVCVPVSCMAGPFAPHSRAEVNLQLYFHRPVIESLIYSVDGALFQTNGIVDILDSEKYAPLLNRRNMQTSVDTMFIGDLKGNEVAAWILPLSIALGLLSLLFLTMTLSKAGFFKRETKEKLELMRETVAAEEDFEVSTSFL